MTLTLRQLSYVLVLAETGHFGRAAERCHVTQPALSQQIRQIEAHTGTLLFDRSGRDARLTPYGRDFLERARAVVAEAQRLEEFVATTRDHPGRPFRFGLIPTVAPYLLPEIFPALTAALPRFSFTISENRTDALLAGLAAGTLDLALIGTEPGPEHPRLIDEVLFDDRFVLATAPDAALADPVPLSALNRRDLLLLDEGHCFRQQSIAACGLDAAAAGASFAATSLSTIVEFVANGQGVTLLPAIALGKEARDARVAIHELEAPGAHRSLRLCWRKSAPHGGIFADVAAIIRGTRADQAAG